MIIAAVPLPDEKWQPISAYENRYAVSTQGRVWSLAHRKGGQLLKYGTTGPRPDRPAGYPVVRLYDGGGAHRTFLVHLLVLQTFVGPCPPGLQACHNNGDPQDPRLSNLRYDTPEGNAADKLAHGTDPRRNKTHCPLGHPYAGDNLLVVARRRGADGFWRSCKACRLEARHALREELRRTAYRNGLPWEQWELDLIVSRPAPWKEVALQLGRTVTAIENVRRQRRLG